ncbi:Uncharacterised protein [Mycobacteroides abscessus subsp. abscessus]|nr:hypothetical protein [Shigella flexneri]SLL37395.1 Uncharacterised protein [Mycobacteroides abscessus subsp. abscessus]
MTNHRLKDIVIPFGLCTINYGQDTLPTMASGGEFKAIPTYKKLTGGKLNSPQDYLLQDYKVSFEVAFHHVDLDMYRYYMQTLQLNKDPFNEYDGLYDSPHLVNMDTKPLIIHPYEAGESKSSDFCIWNAYIDPETEFSRIYDKETNKFVVKFLGKPLETTKLANSYFYIGDWSKVGVF